jgi:predicted Holliday junction resolvase-like endonuclease
MAMWDAVVVLAVVVVFLVYGVVQLAKGSDELRNRIENLEAWVLPKQQKEHKEEERERLRDAIERGFKDGIMVPKEVIDEAYGHQTDK